MLICLILLAIIGTLFGLFFFLRKKHPYKDYNGMLICVLILATILIAIGIVITINDITNEARFVTYQEHYKALCAQISMNLYTYDTMSKRLFDEVEKWNTDLAVKKIYSKSLWTNWFCPGNYEQFKFIPYTTMKRETQ